MGRKQIEVLARGLWICDEAVLVCESVEGGYAYLPGGHVEFGEDAAAALRREFAEESSFDRIRIGTALLVHEHRFEQRGRPKHELNVVFHVEQDEQGGGSEVFHVEHPPTYAVRKPAAVPGRPEIRMRESDIRYRWVVREELVALDLRPCSILPWLIGRLDGRGSGGLEWMSEGGDHIGEHAS